MRTSYLAFLVIDEGKDFIEEFLAVVAEELVVGHENLHNDEAYKRILVAMIRMIQYGSGHGFCVFGNEFFRRSRS